MIVTPTKTFDEPVPVMRLPETPASPSMARKLPQPPQPPTHNYAPAHHQVTYNPSRTGPAIGDDVSRLPPPLLHSLRESFSLLDSDSTGTINPANVAETLQSLGLSTNEMSQLFPPGPPPQISLPQYLNSLAPALASMSPQMELLNAFSAFDDDDSGQVDVAELRKALLTTPVEPGERPLSDRDVDEALKGFTGRRILGKSGTGLSGLRGGIGKSRPAQHGDVFRYREFVSNLSGGPESHQGQVLHA